MLIKARTLNGYKLDATDGEIGRIKGFYFDDLHWAVRYVVADTGNWLTGLQVLISPQWIDRINCNDSKVFINLSSEEIKQAPEYSEEELLTRDYET